MTKKIQFWGKYPYQKGGGAETAHITRELLHYKCGTNNREPHCGIYGPLETRGRPGA